MLQDRLGRYHLEDEVGRGGMAVVYRATDPALQRTVALKVLHPHLADRADSRERFTREARAVARLAHPHIVEVYDYATPESKQAYIVTEFIDGPTLKAFVEAHPIRHGEVAALLMVPVLDALGHAHDAGIVHRDVKPENIMLRSDGSPVLMDFGIAQMIDMETLTKTGMMLGSPAHMAPEVVEGEELTILADIFSIGTVLYWLVCGSLPFSGPNPAALFRRILECRFDPVLQRRPGAGRPLARLIERCLAKDASERPQSCAEIATELRGLLADGGIHDVRQALADYTSDPEVYQDELARRLVPRYLEAAQKAYRAKATARALDFLDRVLALDDEHHEARALLGRIERGRRRGIFLKAAAAVLLVVGLGAFGMQMVPVQPDTFTVPPTPPSTRPVAVAPLALSSDAGVKAVPDAAVAALVDAATPDARRVAVVHRRPVIRHKSLPEPDAAIATGPPARLPVKGGVFKAATVWVDGVKAGGIPQIEARGGVTLALGRHTIRVRNTGCQEAFHQVTVGPKDLGKRLPPWLFICHALPATFRIASNQDAAVRRQDGTLLGRTNQNIRVQMASVDERLSLIVGDLGGKTETLAIRLFAGRRTEKKVNF